MQYYILLMDKKKNKASGYNQPLIHQSKSCRTSINEHSINKEKRIPSLAPSAWMIRHENVNLIRSYYPDPEGREL